MRKTVIACLLLFATGCAAIIPGNRQTNSGTDQFHIALDQLLTKSDPEPITRFIQRHPEAVSTNDAKRILQLYKENVNARNKLKLCNQQVASANAELKKLQADIDRLTQLHLKMGRNNP